MKKSPYKCEWCWKGGERKSFVSLINGHILCKKCGKNQAKWKTADVKKTPKPYRLNFGDFMYGESRSGRR